jgi:hypothetical protein
LSAVDDDIRMRRSQFGEDSSSYANGLALRGIILARLGRKNEAALDLKRAITTCNSHSNQTLRECLPRVPLFYEDCRAVFDGTECAPP